MFKKIVASEPVQKMLAAVGCMIISGVCRTNRIALEGLEHIQEIKDGGGGIIIMWHKTTLLPVYCCRNRGVSPIVSTSRDGNLMAKISVRMLKGEPVRGSAGKDDGVSALKACLRLVRQNRVISITLDGSKGPARKVYGGAAAILKKTGCPFTACGCAIDNPVVFRNSWDKHSEPRPFGRSSVVFTKPQTLPEGLSDEEANSFLAEAVDAAVRKAEERLK